MSGPERGWAVAEGPLAFAGWQEPVDHADPVHRIEEEEHALWKRRREEALVAWKLAEEMHHGSVGYWESLYRHACYACSDYGDRDAATEMAGDGRRISLAQAIGVDEETRAQQARLAHFRIFMQYLCQGAKRRSLADVMRNVLALARRVMPELVGGMTQVEMASLLGDTKQAQEARESRIVEWFQKKRGVAGFRPYGSASGEAREHMAAAAKGNRHRSEGGKRRMQQARADAVLGEQLLRLAGDASRRAGIYSGANGHFQVCRGLLPGTWAVVQVEPPCAVSVGLRSVAEARKAAKIAAGRVVKQKRSRKGGGA